MVEYLLKVVCNWFGYNIIPQIEPSKVQVVCNKENDWLCECIKCMPW